MPKLRVHQVSPEGNPADIPTITADGASVEWRAPGYREVLMTDGVTAPPEPVWCEDGSDWLYSEVIR